MTQNPLQSLFNDTVSTVLTLFVLFIFLFITLYSFNTLKEVASPEAKEQLEEIQQSTTEGISTFIWVVIVGGSIGTGVILYLILKKYLGEV